MAANGTRVTVRAKILALALTLVLLLSAAAVHSLYRSRQIEAELRALTEIFVPLDDRFARLALLSVERDLTYQPVDEVCSGRVSLCLILCVSDLIGGLSDVDGAARGSAV